MNRLLCAWTTLCILSTWLVTRYGHTRLSAYPEIALAPTCVHFLAKGGQAHSPAILTFRNGQPHVTDLATNRTVELGNQKMMMTSPVYRGRSLTEVLQSRPLFDWRNPTVRRIIEQRAKSGWSSARERCLRHWQELTVS